MESIPDLAVVPYRMTSLTSSVVRVFGLFSVDRMFSTDCNISEITMPLSLSPLPPKRSCCESEFELLLFLQDSKIKVLSDEESRRESLAISAAAEKAWTELAWTAMSIWVRVSESFCDNTFSVGGTQKVGLVVVVLSLLLLPTLVTGTSAAATEGAFQRRNDAEVQPPHAVTSVTRKDRRRRRNRG